MSPAAAFSSLPTLRRFRLLLGILGLEEEWLKTVASQLLAGFFKYCFFKAFSTFSNSEAKAPTTQQTRYKEMNIPSLTILRVKNTQSFERRTNKVSTLAICIFRKIWKRMTVSSQKSQKGYFLPLRETPARNQTTGLQVVVTGVEKTNLMEVLSLVRRTWSQDFLEPAATPAIAPKTLHHRHETSWKIDPSPEILHHCHEKSWKIDPSQLTQPSNWHRYSTFQGDEGNQWSEGENISTFIWVSRGWDGNWHSRARNSTNVYFEFEELYYTKPIFCFCFGNFLHHKLAILLLTVLWKATIEPV